MAAGFRAGRLGSVRPASFSSIAVPRRIGNPLFYPEADFARYTNGGDNSSRSTRHVPRSTPGVLSSLRLGSRIRSHRIHWKRGIRVLCGVQTGTRNSKTSRQGVTETIPGRCGSSSRAPPPFREVGKRLRKTRPSGLRSSAGAGLSVACRQLRASPFTPLGRVHIVPGNRAGPEGAPACKHPKRLARPGGLEPPTCGLEVRCSIQLS